MKSDYHTMIVDSYNMICMPSPNPSVLMLVHGPEALLLQAALTWFQSIIPSIRWGYPVHSEFIRLMGIT